MHILNGVGWLLLGSILALPGRSQTINKVTASSQFEEPLVATGLTSPREDDALLRAVQAYKDQPSPDDFRAIEAFLAGHPGSGWRVALLTNLGLSYYHYGYFSKAIDAWERAWQTGRPVTELRVKALVDRAVGELARMHARLGHVGRLETLFREIGDRAVTGPATETIQGAREMLLIMHNDPGVSFLCGPMALENLLLAQGATLEQVRFLSEVRSGRNGVSLAEVARLAEKAKLPYRLIFREAGQPIPVPSIVHWKVTHYAAIVEEAGDRLHIQDPTFGDDLWITRAALESESSGYFLVPSQTTRAVWRNVSTAEAGRVRGMGGTTQTGPLNNDDPKTKHCATTPGMCDYNINEMVVSLNLNDTPVGYAPPRGPAVNVTLTYNQRDGDQPANFAWFNVSSKWTINWLSYIQDDPTNARANALRYVAGGGSVTYTGFNTTTNSYTRETRDASLLVRSSSNPITYERRLADGGREIYSQSNGATTNPRRVFLTQIVDPAGNAVTLSYDNQLRLISITDATNRATKFSYELPARPLLISSITDPFGRSAKIGYDASGRLAQITDVVGLTSQFSYDASNLVNAMTTPYGTTRFSYGQVGADLAASGALRFLEITDSLGYTERVEFRHLAPGIINRDPLFRDVPKGMPTIENDYLGYRNTFYWDKHAYPLAYAGTPSYTNARMRHWEHLSTNEQVTSHVLDSSKQPYENRVWFSYPGQPNGLLSGTLDKPSGAGRVLDDGSTQLNLMAYNTLGHMTRRVDPAGRETQYVYDGNLIDLLQVKQKTSTTGFSTIAEFTYNTQHLPLTIKDAAGQIRTYAYNSAGQLTQLTDALGQVTRYEYDSLGYLTRIVNANGQTAASFVYDSAGRVATHTDSEGLFVSFSYDALDRITKETFADGSTREYTWDKLDLVAVKDRQGRVTRYAYDAVRNLVEVSDPMGRKTRLSYYENGSLKSLIDPNGNVTTWTIDIQDRVTGKQYADGSQSSNTYEKTTSRLKSITDALGQVKQYSYTLDDQVAGIAYTNAVNPTPNVRLTYDPYFRRLSSMTDGSGTRTYQYQPLGAPGALRLAQESGPYQNDGIGYQYDELGRLIGRTVDASAETFAYDSLSRLTSHVSPLGTFDLGYLGETGQMTSRQLRAGPAGTTWSYDTNTNDRRLTAIASSGPARGYRYTTTPENIIARIVETAASDGAAPTQTWDYAYDQADRLLQGVSSGGVQYAYGYDSSDNILSQQGAAGAQSASYNALNQIAGLSSGQNFIYDANGNLTDDGVRNYNWDAENRLIGIVSKADPAQVVTFRYDGLGRRTAIVGPGGVETRYLWCGEALCQARDSNDAVSRRYYSEGELVPGGAGLFYAQDHLGSVRDVLSPDGSLVASYDYDAYGNPVQTGGAAGTDFRYAGMFYEQNSGLYLTHYRAYDPRTARWLSRDPIEERGGINLYSYASVDPANRIDPLGLVCWRLWGGVLKIGLGTVDILVGGTEFVFGTLIGFTGVGVPATIVLYTESAVEVAVGLQEWVEGVKSILGAYTDQIYYPDTNPPIPYTPPAPGSPPPGHITPVMRRVY